MDLVQNYSRLGRGLRPLGSALSPNGMSFRTEGGTAGCNAWVVRGMGCWGDGHNGEWEELSMGIVEHRWCNVGRVVHGVGGAWVVGRRLGKAILCKVR